MESLELKHVRIGQAPCRREEVGNWDVMSYKIGVKSQLCSSVAVRPRKVNEPCYISGSLLAIQGRLR